MQLDEPPIVPFYRDGKELSTMPSKTTKRTSAPTAVKRPQRKASFEVKTVKGEKQFSCVNKRAHKLARIMGKRTKLTVTELQTALGKRPNIHAYAYSNGTLKAVKF